MMSLRDSPEAIGPDLFGFSGLDACWACRSCRLGRASLIPNEAQEQQDFANWELLNRSGMIYVLILALVAVTFLLRSLIAPSLP